MTRFALLGSALFLALGCSSSGSAGGGEDAGVGAASWGGTAGVGSGGLGALGGVGGQGPTACAGLPKSQPVSGPCCLDHGVDACGAGLFCAAFDGRVQPTCYLDGSRLDLTECGDDAHCVSGSCNLDTHRCRSRPGANCELATGCVASGTKGYVCADSKCVASDGTGGEPCGTMSDCQMGQCVGSRCLATEGAACKVGSDSCAAGLCCETTCQVCGAGHGEKCSALPLPPPFGMPCKPGLICCGSSIDGPGHCYPSC